MEQYTEHRSWGSFTVFVDEDNFKTKRLDVLAGKRLSLQSHQYRSEHWIIVKGRAKITIAEDIQNYSPGKYLFVPQKTKHRIENIGNELLTIIEVQTGEYLGEDDIIRYEDDFGRHVKPEGS